VIKFRCPACGRKIAANDEAADRDVDCPSCAQRIVVPLQSMVEFQACAKPPRQLRAVPVLTPNLISVPPPHLSAAPLASDPSPPPGMPLPAQELRRGLMPHLARLMTNRLFQAVLSQRAHLLGSQHHATAALLALEQRMIKIQQQYQSRIAVYEERVHELERQVRILRTENQALVRARIQSAGEAAEKEYIATPIRGRLHNAGVLLDA
jgi:DNA-directed RNA polymerase subunit RPC12/RpoP